MPEILTVGTRGSRLALLQAQLVIDRLKFLHPFLEIRTEIIKTAGDKNTSAPFIDVGAPGIFVREIENALIEKKIDLAVHSLKDLQTNMPPELEIGAIPERESACDVLISRFGLSMKDLPNGTVFGTSSARRRGLLAAEGRGFQVKECRGNLPTRIEKLERGDFDAIILAEAGLKRLGLLSKVTEYLDINHFVPAPGQGAIAVEIRKNDFRLKELVAPLNHEPTFIACMEERAFLAAIGGGCHAPVGANASFRDDKLSFVAFVGTIDGKWFARESEVVDSNDFKNTGIKMAERIKSLHGSELFFRKVDGNVS